METHGLMESDAELVRRLLRGDEAAFERFFATAYPALYRFALARLDFDHDAAGEVAQAAICKAATALMPSAAPALRHRWMAEV